MSEPSATSRTVATRPGRPKDAAKRHAIIEAARTLFARHPFEAVTMEQVAAQAGVSKMTVYSHFTDKETLFEAIVRLMSQRLSDALTMSADGSGLADRLTRIGDLFLRMILDHEVAAMMQTVPAVLRHNQNLARRFYEAGPGRTLADLAGIITEAVKAGQLQVDDASLAAEDLISLWLGGLQGCKSFGLITTVSAEEIGRRAQRGTAVFLRAYQIAEYGERSFQAASTSSHRAPTPALPTRGREKKV